METEVISVIVPVFNAGAYLRRCLDTVARQTYRNLEIILVDDGSTDGSGAICDDFAAKDSRCRVIHQERSGSPYIARGAGKDQATGDYILFVDADDYLHLDLIRVMYEAINAGNGYDMALADRRMTERQDEDIEEPGENTVTELSREALIARMFEGPDELLFVYLWNKLFRRTVLDGLSFHGYPRSEDFDYCFRVYLNIDRAVWVHRALYFYVQHPASLVHQGDKAWDEYYRIMPELLFREATMLPADRLQFRRYPLRMLYRKMLVLKDRHFGKPTQQEVFEACAGYERQTLRAYWCCRQINILEKMACILLLHNPRLTHWVMRRRKDASRASLIPWGDILTEKERQGILFDADAMLAGRYRFDGVWDMEPFTATVKNPRPRWDVRYQGDPEWSYMFTRMDWLWKLRVAAELTDDHRYANHGLKVIDRWWHDNRKFLGKYSGRIAGILCKKNNLGHRSLDMAIMAANVVDFTTGCRARGWISEKRQAGYWRRMERVVRHVVDRAYGHDDNWGIQESGNVVYCLLRMGRKEVLDPAQRLLVRLVHRQILSDGSSVEAAPMYLVQILLVLLKILNLPGNPLREDLLPAVLQGCRYVCSIRTPSGCLPNIGDSDMTDISDLMLLASHILEDGSFSRYATRPLHPEFIARFGIGCREPAYEVTPERGLVRYRYQTVLRTEDTYLLCSNLPRIIDGHKHCDYLSVLYSLGAKDMLIDLGRYSYKDEFRRFYTGPNAHNTIVHAGDSPFWQYAGSWRVDENMDCFENHVAADTEGRWVAVRMKTVMGYREETVDRLVIHVRGMGLLVTDIVADSMGKGSSFETVFNIGKDFTASPRDGQVFLSDAGGLGIVYRNDHRLPAEIRSVDYSPRYNVRIPVEQLRILSDGDPVTHMFLKGDVRVDVAYRPGTVEYVLPAENLRIEVTLT